MTSEKKSHNGTWNIKAQEQFRKEQGRYKSNLKAGDAHLKTIIIGDGAVGKTTLLITYVLNEIPGEYIPTVFDNNTTGHKYNGKTYQLNLWDTAGREDYDRLRPLAYPHTDVLLVAFSLITKDSFNNLKTKWIPEIKYHCPGIPFLIIGTKDDLRQAQMWGNVDNINKLVHGYLRLNGYKDTIPLDILSVIETYLIVENHYKYNKTFDIISDKDAEEMCKELGGDKYLFCSSLEKRGLYEIFNQVCISWGKLEKKWGNKDPTKSNKSGDKSCVLL